MDELPSVTERLQEYEGELRANTLRAASVVLFYLVELANYRGLSWGPLQLPKVSGVDRGFHLAMTTLALAWLLTSWGVYGFLRRRVFPPALKYLSTGLDLVFLTAVLLVADGPRSPLVVGYFIVLCLAALRLSVRLVRFAAAGAVLGYLVLLGDARWLKPALRIPRYHQVDFLLALVLCGVVLGQVLRRARARGS
ncbi:MAG: hypothetical protein KGL53_04200 [Elusimicrobia bacterium]|nr:hypothetical protein [Elusimicrobiota bacterium]